jgi:hypothetical protein
MVCLGPGRQTPRHGMLVYCSELTACRHGCASETEPVSLTILELCLTQLLERQDAMLEYAFRVARSTGSFYGGATA